jgi:hypothetical protein
LKTYITKGYGTYSGSKLLADFKNVDDVYVSPPGKNWIKIYELFKFSKSASFDEL